jgi:TDG/mug DNA glycosylase family protein
VQRATARASELTSEELRSGGALLAAKVADLRPAVVAIAGITAYRTAFGQKQAVVGRQADAFSGAELWVVPNPSGLNAHETTESLTEWYRRVGVAAGVVEAGSE